MKYLMIPVVLIATLCVDSCQRSVSMVPPNSRPVVGPSGSTASPKSWSGVTRQEGEAVLGPLSNTRR